MADFYPAWNNTCQIVRTIRNEYSDQIDDRLDSVQCIFRIINTIQRGTNQEVNDSDATVWFPIETSVSLGDLITKDGVYYQIERINYAQGLRNAPQFIKCDLKINKAAIS